MKLWQKLMEIQKAIPAFVNSEKSDKKKPGSKNSEYLYTPGWQIVEAVRKELDSRGIMMPISVISEEHKMVEYPVYKVINGNVVSFIKKENLSVITMEYSWVDTDSGETAGPYRMIASGANGIDKSTAAALSTAERYAILKFFHVPCKDAGVELDAHDSTNIPGLKDQPMNATDSQIAGHKNGSPIRQIPSAEPPMPPQYPQYPSQQAYSQQTLPKPGYGKEYEEAVNRIAMFGKGTQSHTEAVNAELAKLSTAGYPVGDRNFVETLILIADEKRLKN